jgi:hypothetical protein
MKKLYVPNSYAILTYYGVMAFIDYILDPPSYSWKNEKDGM